MPLPFGFTERDNDLFGGRRYIDPLGVGPVWTNLARRLIPHLTALSSRADGFELLLSSVAMYEEYAQWRGEDRRIPFREFYLLLEQAFAHSTAMAGNEWKLPGSRVVRASTGNIQISLAHPLLDSQFTGGTWGRYSAAAGRARLITTDPARLIEENREQVRSGLRRVDTQSILRAIQSAAKNSYTLNRAEWKDNLAYLITKIPHRGLLRQRIIEAPIYDTPPGYPTARPALLQEVARRLVKEFSGEELEIEGEEELKVDDAALRRFVKGCAKSKWNADEVGDAAQIFEDILCAESYLAPLENLFDLLFAFRGRKVAQVADQLEIPLAEIADACAAFRRLTYWNETARRRAALYSGLSFDSPVRLIQTLVGVHADVSQSRGRQPWILVDEGSITILVEQSPPKKAPLSPSRAWRNHYYLISLLGVARGLDAI